MTKQDLESKNQLEKRYGFPTALSMVIGIVIGSGIFFKAAKVLRLTGGDMKKSLLVVGMVGAICIICSLFFAKLGKDYSHCNGLMDYAEATIGPKYAYMMGWFLACFYNPIIAATLSYIAASYVSMLCGLEMYGQTTTGISVFFLITLIVINMLAPKLAGKLQVSTTIIKLIPLVAMAIIGLIMGLINGNTLELINHTTNESNSGGILAGIVAFAFSYEGWIACTSINAELKNPKRDLPLALIIGCIFCTLLYMAYVLSMSATLKPEQIIEAGDYLPIIAFSNVFGNFIGSIILVFIIISCLGTANGMVMATMRSFYSIAIRGYGPKPEILSEVDKTTGMPLKSCIIGTLFAGFWLFQLSTLFFQGPLAFNGTGNPEWLLAWEADEICIITLYAMYIPIYLFVMIKHKEYNILHRYIIPMLALIVSLFMCYSCIISYGIQILYYLIFFGIIMLIGLLLMNPKIKN